MCWHKWGKWEEYNQNMTVIPGILSPKEIRGKEYSFIENRQKRKCEKCGKTQDEEVRGR